MSDGLWRSASNCIFRHFPFLATRRRPHTPARISQTRSKNRTTKNTVGIYRHSGKHSGTKRNSGNVFLFNRVTGASASSSDSISRKWLRMRAGWGWDHHLTERFCFLINVPACAGCDTNIQPEGLKPTLPQTEWITIDPCCNGIYQPFYLPFVWNTSGPILWWLSRFEIIRQL